MGDFIPMISRKGCYDLTKVRREAEIDLRIGLLTNREIPRERERERVKGKKGTQKERDHKIHICCQGLQIFWVNVDSEIPHK